MVSAIILAKNEAANIGRSVKALVDLNVHVTILDSGSTDGTQQIASSLGAEVKDYHYPGHCEAYNDLTRSHTDQEWIMVLDADMVVSQDLFDELRDCALTTSFDVIAAPVRMVHEGFPLRRASLYPPKPILFRGGGEYFRPVGHGEAIRAGVSMGTVKRSLVHDDRKGFRAYMESQIRYSDALTARAGEGNLSLRDRVRRRTPIGILAVPFVSLIIRGGLFDGRGGLVYAVDRLIAEAIMWRSALINPHGSASSNGTNRERG
jgi:glycosyltransferase involved in cell wall biosynthesis